MYDIENKVINLIEKLFDLDRDALRQRKNVFLTGKEFQLNYYDMLILMLNLEKYFEIKLEKEDVLEYGLATIENIITIISRKLA